MIKPYKFELYELVDRTTHDYFGEKAWWFLDQNTLTVLSWLRRRYGRAWVNNWFWGGKSQFRGFRPSSCFIGAARSQHRFGRALDLTFADYTAEEIRESIRATGENVGSIKLIGAIENSVNWLHFDTRNRIDGKILWFDP